MSKEKATTEKPIDTSKLVDDNAINDTISPAPLTVPAEGDEDEVKVSDAPKTVNIPLSASNALQPEAGVQIITGAPTEEIAQTDPYNPQMTKLQNVLTDDVEDDGKVSKAKYDALLGAFNHVLDNTMFDVVQVQHYKAIAGIK